MLIEQIKTKTQEALEYKMYKQLETFSFNHLINLSEEDKWMLAINSFKATNSVFNITDENNSFSTSTPGHWYSRGGAEIINHLQQLLKA